MKAIVLERYGGPEALQLKTLDKPVPGDNEVLIRICAALATPSDVAFRSGKPFIVRLFTGLSRPKFPVIGDSLAGEIEAVGKNVTRFKVGDSVFGSADTAFGAYAEYKCLPEDGSIAVMPAGLGCDEAAAISEGFLTAMPFLRDEAKVLPGQKVLINGASGSVGQMAVQLAKYFGAEVTGVCSTTNLKLVRSLAADAVIDYTRDDFTSRTGAWDVIFDAVGKSSFARCRDALTPRGVYMTTVPSFAILPQMAWTKIFSGGKRALLATTGLRSSSAKARDLVLLSELVDAGKLRVVIDRRYPMEQIADAHAYVETGRKKGSVVVVIAEEGAKLLAA